MKIFNRICSIVLIFAVSAFIVCFAQNVIFRTSGVYGFYFNDSRVVDGIYTSLSNNEMADEIASFMCSWRPEKFEVLEFTGYDHENVFSEEDSHIMIKFKRILDMSGVVCIVGFILTASIYVYFMKTDNKRILAKSYKASLLLTIAAIVGETLLMVTNNGRTKFLEFFDMTGLPEESQLLEILDGNFVTMSAFFLVGLTVIITVFITYVTLIITRPPRMFY